MNVILLEPYEIGADNAVVLNDRRHEHLVTILKSQPGETIRIGLINGPLGRGLIEQISRRETRLRAILDETPPPAPAVDLILALPRPIMLKRIIAQAAALGVGKIFLTNANRVEKSFFQTSLLDKTTLREHLLLGLEQAVDTRLPEVSVHQRFRPFVEDFLPNITAEYAHRFIAHPGVENSLAQAASPLMAGRILLAIGPEGGWVDFEIDKFRTQDFTPIHIGQRIVRVETAVTALLAQLDLLRQLSSIS